MFAEAAKFALDPHLSSLMRPTTNSGPGQEIRFRRHVISPARRRMSEAEFARLRDRYASLARRMAGPLAHSDRAFHRTNEQIRILSRLIDAEILQFDNPSAAVLPPGLIRKLICQADSWCERLENQQWLAGEVLRHTRRLIGESDSAGLPAARAIDSVSQRILETAGTVPNGSLLLPEPGIRLDRLVRGRISAARTRRIVERVVASQWIAWIARRAGERRPRQTTLVQLTLGGWTRVGSRKFPLIHAAIRLAQMASRCAGDGESIVLSDLRIEYIAAVQALREESGVGRICATNVERLIDAFDLNPVFDENERSVERHVALSRLRRHVPDASRVESRVPAPKFLQRRKRFQAKSAAARPVVPGAGESA